MLGRWGSFSHRHPFWTLTLSGVVLALSIVFLVRGGELKNPRSLNLEAGHASDLAAGELPHTGGGGSSFSLIFTSDHVRVADARYRDAVEAAVRPLTQDSRVKQVITPWNIPAPDPTSTASPATQVSADQTSAVVYVLLKDSGGVSRKYYGDLRGQVHPGPLKVLAFDGVAEGNAFDTYLQTDLSRAEVIALPATILLLLLVFGALVAAGLPLLIGLVSILGGIGGIYAIAGFTDVSSYAQNVVTLIGLGVSIDYSLFIVNRFREELARGVDREQALATTMATAGRAIMFSGLTVAVGLSGMLFYTGSFLPSMGIAGAMVVGVAVFYSLTLLPALLRLLGPRINAVRVPIAATGSRKSWHRLAMGVMAHPVVVLVPTVAFIVLAGLPFGHLRMANGGIEELPATAEVRQGYDLSVRKFPGSRQTTVEVVLEFPGDPLTPSRVGAAYDLSRRIAKIKGVTSVSSVVDLDPALDRAAYQALYSAPASTRPPKVAQALKQGVGKHVMVLNASTDLPAESDPARDIVRAIRADRTVADGRLEVTGETAFDLDIVNFIVDRTPAAVGFIVGVTIIVLFLLLGSVVLPIKAVVMNFLSLSASFGALVWVFQDGHLAGLLGFTPQAVDPSIPVLLFCIVFGLSMDYEVLLMSRMKEEWERTRDNRHAVAEGLELSGRLVTGAAAIMFAVFIGFGLAQVLLIKSLGIGMAIAVLIDATLVRALIVPATMRLLGQLNWWAPGPVARLYRRLGLGEASAVVRPEPEPAGP
ncbi:MAG: putative drug exporter of the superfamily [Chloroflexota bacterium]|jgi:RND superfamily putative drug exporter|nr:putative drug exporter of the superfamily [Chloroflexota bacterium]